jgi:hypothetical protein
MHEVEGTYGAAEPEATVAYTERGMVATLLRPSVSLPKLTCAAVVPRSGPKPSRLQHKKTFDKQTSSAKSDANEAHHDEVYDPYHNVHLHGEYGTYHDLHLHGDYDPYNVPLTRLASTCRSNTPNAQSREMAARERELRALGANAPMITSTSAALLGGYLLQDAKPLAGGGSNLWAADEPSQPQQACKPRAAHALPVAGFPLRRPGKHLPVPPAPPNAGPVAGLYVGPS